MTIPISPLIIKGLVDLVEGTAVVVSHKESTINWTDGMIRHMPMQTQITLRKEGLDATVLLTGRHTIPEGATVTVYKPNITWHAGHRIERPTAHRVSGLHVTEMLRAFRVDTGKQRFYAPEYEHHVQQLYAELEKLSSYLSSADPAA